MSDDDGALGSPPVDRVGEDVAMARVGQLLFGDAPAPTLERYALLEKLGEGGYGAVYSAWDPRLDRKIAVKVLHGGPDEALEREARALAKLAHPNVVAVHDVGESEGALFLAMEFVDGAPLSSLDVRTLGWRGVVTTYRQAAAGLAAAHDAGVVHRDFKPDNAVLGRDGRVRVLDFGLARAAAGAHVHGSDAVQTRAGGTPRYMAPEQHRGAAVDARTDQYCFCVALWEALYGQTPFDETSLDTLAQAKEHPPAEPPRGSIPARVGRILLRGMAPASGERHPSMRAVDEALRRCLRRRTQAAAGAGIASVALLVGIGLGTAERPCAGLDAPPSRWTASTRSALEVAFEQTGLPHAETSARSTHALLNRWTERWGAARTDACQQHAQGLQSAEGLDLRTSCLDRQRERWGALLDVLLDADATVVNRAVEATAALPDPSACADLEALRTEHLVPPDEADAVSEARNTLARARAELDAGHYARAVERATPNHAACTQGALTHPPTCVEASLIRADANSYLGRHEDALEGLREAAAAAQRARLHVAFAEAASTLVWELGEVDGDFDAATSWAALGHASLDGENAPAQRLRLLNNEGGMLFTAGRWDEAVRTHQRRLAALEGDSPLRMHSLVNLGNIDNRRGRVSEADDAYAEAIALGAEAYGATHPRVLMTRQNRAGMWVRVGRIDSALTELEGVLELQRSVLGPEHPELAATLVNIANAHLARGDAQQALSRGEEATRLVVAGYGPDAPLALETKMVEAEALLALGRSDDAVEASERAAELATTLFGAEHVNTAYALRSWGSALIAQGRHELGRDKLLTARASFEALDMGLEVQLTTSRLDQSTSRSD